MKKYTIQQIKDQKLAVNCHSYEEGEKISMALQPEWYKNKWGLTNFKWENSTNFSIINYTSRLGWMPNDKEPDYFVKDNTATAYIDFNQVIFEEEKFAVPEKWVMEIHSQEEFELFKNYWFEKQPDKKSIHKDALAYIIPYYCAYDECGIYYSYNNKHVYNTHKLITIEQFKKHILMEKKIIGYKAPMDLFGGYNPDVVKGTLFVKLIDEHQWYTTEKEKLKSSPAYVFPKEIVETWEPVYEDDYKVGDWIYIIDRGINVTGCKTGEVKQIKSIEASPHYEYRYIIEYTDGARSSARDGCLRKATPVEIEKLSTKTIRMGGADGFDLTIKGGKVYHKDEDITNYVNNVNKEFGSFINNHKMNSNLDFTISDMIITKSGCESKKTMLSEWLNIYKLISQ